MPEVVVTTPVPNCLTKLSFLKRFTFSERVAIETAAEGDPEVRVIKESFTIAEEICLNDSETIGSVDLYLAKGLLTPERRDEVLGVGG